MLDWFLDMVSMEGFVPHAYCFAGRNDLIMTFVISDVIIALSYFSIPVALIYFSLKRKDLSFKWVFILFSAFIVACGSSHVVGAVTFWYPFYGAEALVTATTALLSLITALALWPLMPKALALPSRLDLEIANRSLREETRQRRQAETELKALNATLESRIEERTRDLNQSRLTAEAANTAKSEFLAMMSHELRTPLNIILGFAELMRDGSDDEAVKIKLSEYATDIFDSGSHLLEVINDILDISKLDAGKLEIEASTIDFERAIVDLSRVMALRVTKAGLSLTHAIDADARFFRADERAIKQILINLVSNAIKYTPHDGRVEITAMLTPDDQVMISVSDTGIGIPPEKVRSLGTPFVKVDNRYSQTANGTGLGLALVKGLVTLHPGLFSSNYMTRYASIFMTFSAFA